MRGGGAGGLSIGGGFATGGGLATVIGIPFGMAAIGVVEAEGILTLVGVFFDTI